MAKAAFWAVALMALLHVGFALYELISPEGMIARVNLQFTDRKAVWNNALDSVSPNSPNAKPQPETNADKDNRNVQEAAKIVRNAGIYNSFIAAGLIWGLFDRRDGFRLRVFFLVCVIIAGIVGRMTLPEPTTLYLQTLPGAGALFLVCLAERRRAAESSTARAVTAAS